MHGFISLEGTLHFSHFLSIYYSTVPLVDAPQTELLDIDSLQKFLQLPYFDLDPRLSKGVVILDPIQNFSHAPKAVGFNIFPVGLVQTFKLKAVSCYVNVDKIL